MKVSGYEIPGFPDLSNCFLGVRDRGRDENKIANAGYNPNFGIKRSDRERGFTLVYDKAWAAAKGVCELVCKDRTPHARYISMR